LSKVSWEPHHRVFLKFSTPPIFVTHNKNTRTNGHFLGQARFKNPNMDVSLFSVTLFFLFSSFVK